MAMQKVEVGLEVVELPAGTLAFQNQVTDPLFYAFDDDEIFFVAEKNDIIKPPSSVTVKVKYKTVTSYYGKEKDTNDVIYYVP
jgi:hypothetical protein